MFYDFTSFVPERYKSNLVCCLVYRIYRIVSDYQIFHRDISTLRNKLVVNGFTKYFVDYCTKRVLDNFYNPTVGVPTVPRDQVLLVLPFLGHISYTTKRQITKLVQKFYPSVELKIVFKRGLKLSSVLNCKDRLPLSCRSGVVYYT